MTLLSRVLNHHTEKNGLRRTKSSSLSSANGAKNAKRNSSCISLNINLESPPIVLYGHAHESSGSLVSGVLTLEVHPKNSRNGLSPQASAGGLHPQMSMTSINSVGSVEEWSDLTPNVSNEASVEVESVVLQLIQTVHYTKPFMASSSQISACKQCAIRKNTLAEWDVLLEKSAFPVGPHAYPFSHLLPGLLAASSKLGSQHSYSYIKYDLVAVASAAGKETSVTLPVNVLRSILRGPDRNSLRVFPPTEVTASAVLPGVMYPKSTFPIELRMGHVVNSRQDRRWRMRKLLWKLEEHTQIAAHACEEHVSKLQSIEESQKKMQTAKRLRAGGNGDISSNSSAGDGPSKSNGMHHLTIQTLMFVGNHPTNPLGAIRAAALDTPNSNEVPAGNHDIVEPEEEVPTNRVMDEVVHFEEDFGNASIVENITQAQPQPQQQQQNNSTVLETPQLAPAQTTNSQHAHVPQGDSENSRKSLFLDELRVVAHGDIKSGWKSDFLGDGTIELVAEISALDCSSGIKRHAMKALSNDTPPDELHEGLRNDANVSCDINDPVLGIYVGHVLVLEVIVAEEIVLQPKGSNIPKEDLVPVTSASSVTSNSNLVGVPTGAARVLRMQFKMIMTERSGLGIAWDDEVPPMYEDVRALSPPTYETLAIGTPISLHGLLPALSGQRTTPSVIYGLGNTPLLGSFATNRPANSIDAIADLDEHVQEFRL